MRRRLCLVTLFVSTAAPNGLHGQFLTRAPFGTLETCRAASAAPLVLVRYDPPPKGGEEGPVVACDSTGVLVGPFAGQTSSRRVRSNRIRTLAIRRPSGAIGALWGGAVGGAAGLTFGLVRTQPCGTGICHGSVFAPTAISLVTGAALGWMISHGLWHWKVIYRAFP